jgi:RNA polymerase-binding transcription factor
MRETIMARHGSQIDSQIDVEAVRRKLRAERERLIDMRRGLEETAADPTTDVSVVNQHPADAGSDTFERSKTLAILDRADRHLSDVDRALERLDRGNYGVCEACGEPIGPTRLNARPAARLCLRDQELAEEQESAAR